MSALLSQPEPSPPADQEKEKEEGKGLKITRCWASSGGDWTMEEEEGGQRARPVLARSVRAGYQHSLAHSVATQLARLSAGGRPDIIDRERMSLATR